MARRISRRPKVVWLPVDRFNRLGQPDGTGITLPTQTAWGQRTVFVPGGAGTSASLLAPLVADTPINPALAGAVNSLADIEQSAYRLRRVVGKVFCSMAQSVNFDAGAPSGILASFGLIVLRVDNFGSPLNVVTEDYNVNNAGNISDPWIWRRSWALSDFVQAAGSPGTPAFQEANTYYGSVQDGPHVDAKTARIVGPEERLFAVMTATSIDGNDAVQLNGSVRFIWDLRVLASMRSSQGNRRNASR